MIYQEVIFTEEECEKIITYKDKYDLFLVTPKTSLIENTRTVYHKENDYNGMEVEFGKDWVKKYNVWDIPINEETIWFYDKIYTWFISISGVKIDKSIYFNNPNGAHKLHEYVIGDKFDLHTDKTDSRFDYRIWNLGIQLNSEYDGGDYICYNKNGDPIFISKEIGNVVAYSSDVLHEVTEIKNGIRYSMVIKIHSWELFNKNKKTLI
jgi:hypothetical protein